MKRRRTGICFKDDWKAHGKPNGCACFACIRDKMAEWERDGTSARIDAALRKHRKKQKHATTT